jgi:hypothetical protein
MIGWLFAKAFLVGVSSLVISFVLTFALCLAWAELSSPGNSAQGDMGAFFLAIMVAPAVGIGCFGLSLSKFKLRKDPIPTQPH